MKRVALSLVLAWLAVRPAAAFNLERYRDPSNGKWYPVRWAPGTRTIRFQLNDRPLTLLPNLVGIPSVDSMVQAAMQAWSFAPISLQLQQNTAKASWVLDGVNLISFADTKQNRDIIQQGEALGATLRWWTRAGSQSYWRISEVDIVLDPRVQFAGDGRPGVYDLPGIMTHELGHALGLSHSPVASAVMWAYSTPGNPQARFIDPDDMNAVNAVYGDSADPNLGTIAGDVVTSTGPVFGAHVVATGSDGVVRGSAFTDVDGSFSLPLLPPDRYLLYVEPINGEHTTGAFSYDYYHSARRNFRPTFLGGNVPRAVLVSAGATVGLDPITVQAQPSSLNIQYVGGSVNGNDFSNVNAQTLTMRPGGYTNLLILGHGLSRETQIQASGPDISFLTSNINIEEWSDGLTGLYVPMSVRSGATPGGRNIYVRQNGEVAAYIGGIKVVRP